MKSNPPPETEWNFDDVPEHELAACCLWEYARESAVFAMSSRRHGEMMKELLGRKPQSPAPDPEYEEFLEAFWNTDEGYQRFYETIRKLGGPSAPAWRKIVAARRAALSQQARMNQFCPALAPASRGNLEALWKANLVEWDSLRQQPGYDANDDLTGCEPSLPHRNEPGHAGEPHGATSVAFTIEFRRFTDQQIIEAFTTWLKTNRPDDSPAPTLRGRKLRDLRVALDRLGMMRLLHHFTLREMPACCPEAWKAFEGYDWYKERRRSLATFRRLFPFLPGDDLPVSWPTKGGRTE